LGIHARPAGRPLAPCTPVIRPKTATSPTEIQRTVDDELNFTWISRAKCNASTNADDWRPGIIGWNGDLDKVGDRHRTTGRTAFFKASYLFQM